MIRLPPSMLPLVAAGLLFSSPSAAAWSAGLGEWIFGPDMSEREACLRAERKAKEAALRKVTGETMSSEDLMVCREQGDDAECRMNRITWSMIDGNIRDVRNVRKERRPGPQGSLMCRVSLEVNVDVGQGRPDPNFDMAVRLNRRTLRHGDPMQIEVVPTQPMYVSVFQWLPYESAERQVVRIFPNPYDRKNHFQGRATVPTASGRQAYDLYVGFPEDLADAKTVVDEYLMVIGTKDQVRFRESYSLNEFTARLLEIPRQDWRRVRKAYNVVRSE